MNIKELQIEKAKREAITSSIKKGKEPILSQINTYIKNKFKYAPAGAPSFKPILGKKYDCSNSKEFNQMMTQIRSDLDDLFDADNYINNEILSTSNYYEAEKSRLTGELNKLQNDLSNIMTIIEQPQIGSNISDTFDNFNGVEFVGDSEKNVAKTGAYIDLKGKYVANNTTFINKIALKDAKVSCEVLSDNLKNEQISDIKYCIGDNINESWIQKVTTENNDTLYYNVGVILSEESEVNTIIYTASSPRKQTIKLSLLDKDGNVFALNSIATSERAEWNFKNVKIASMVFSIEKQECDATNGVDCEYYIGAKNISIYNNTYIEKSVFTSLGFLVEHPFSQIAFTAQEDIPASTNITYYVGFESKNDSTSWMQVNNNAITELNLLSSKRVVIEPGTADSTEVIKLNDTPISKTVKLYTGVDMWQVRTCKYTEELLPREIISTPISEFKEMNYIKYIAASLTSSIYTCYADFDEATVISGNFYGEDITHAVYVNGAKITGQQSESKIEYRLRMAKGTNQIQILVINDSNNDKSFKFDAYVQEYASMVRAIDVAKETDMYEIEYGLHTDTFDKFTVEDNTILVNYEPNKYNIRYIADYRYTDNPELFEDAKLRVMAVLYSKNHNVSPRLYSYQVSIL